MYSIRVPGHLRDRLTRHLADGGIMSKVFFYPIHKTHFYKDELKYDCVLPVTEKMSAQVLSLPMHPALTEEEITVITGHTADYFSKV
jgi:perosamine synthetase